MRDDQIACRHCEQTIEETSLRKCSVCFKYFCDDHAHHMSGRAFCTDGCAQYFFFHEPED